MKLIICPTLLDAKIRMTSDCEWRDGMISKAQMMFIDNFGNKILYRYTQWIREQRFRSYYFSEIEGIELVDKRDLFDLKRRII